MSKIKAVVLEKSGSLYTVLGQDGTFRQVHRRLNAEVGEEVQIQLWTEYFSSVRIWSGAVALFFLVFTTLLGWNLYQAPTAVALLSIDINPSIQFALDNKGHLLEFENQDEEAERLLSQIDLKGKPLEEVLEQIISQAYDQKFLSPEHRWVVVGYSPMSEKTKELMPKELNENQIRAWLTEIGESKGLIPHVAVFSLTSQERELAQNGDLTLGEYALWQTANTAGVTTQLEKLKDTSELSRLLENPQIQVQIKAKKERQSVSPQTPETLKRDLVTKGKPSENNSEKPLPVGKPFSSIKVMETWINNSRSKDMLMDQKKEKEKQINSNNTKAEDKQKPIEQSKHGSNADQQKDQEIGKTDSNGKDQDNQKANNQEEFQNKALDKSENSKDIKLQRSTYEHFVPQILTSRNLSRDPSRTNKSPDKDRDKRQSRNP